VWHLDQQAAYVQISMQDNGIGFSQDHAERIFKTFTRLNPKDKYEGTGLGLALCKKIVERHNGAISAAGIEGMGSVFNVVLPLQQPKKSA
jgi:signal transduction histidine kinase